MRPYPPDLTKLCWEAANNQLAACDLLWSPQTALGVVMAAGGYPFAYDKGAAISGLDHVTANTKVFHAGTSLEGKSITTSGGRVLCVTALGDNIQEAQRLAYEGVGKINWENAFYRKDIGYRAIKNN